MFNNVLTICFLLALPVNVVAQRSSPTTRKSVSPDGAAVVIVTSTKALEATPESVVEIRSSSGTLLVRKSYSSGDGEHGDGVTKGEWTPDSRFFVYSSKARVAIKHGIHQ